MKKLALLLSFAPLAAFAQIQQGPGAQQLPNAPIQTLTGVTGFICYGLSWAFTFLIIFTVVFVMIAAWKYLTAGGDAKKAGEANQMILYAAIAVALAIFAKGLPSIVSSFLGSGALSGC
jgi:uncharacterized membrane protein